MNRGTFKHIEEIVRDYPKINSYLKEREEELLNPFNEEPDENVGGGRSSMVGKPTERKAMTILEDRRLVQLKKQQEAVDKAFKDCDDLTNECIKKYYMTPDRPTWEYLSTKMSIGQISVKTLIRSRNMFFEKVRQNLGW